MGVFNGEDSLYILPHENTFDHLSVVPTRAASMYCPTSVSK